jgi:type VI secretion system secreted protein Hcp
MPIFVQYSGIDKSIASLPSDQKWIEIDSMQWGIGRSISSPSGGSSDRESSTPSVSEIVVTKTSDQSSAGLFQACLGAGAGGKINVSIIFKNSAGVLSHTLKLKDAALTQFVPRIAQRGGRGKVTWLDKLTFGFSRYDFNGLGSVPIPHTLVHF